MSVALNHTIVKATDKRVSCTFLAGLLDLPVQPQWGPFLPIRLDNDVTLEFMDVDSVDPQHYSFLVSNEVFDAAFARIQKAGLDYWADPFRKIPGMINQDYGGRGVYFDDPDGHTLELQTTSVF